MLGEVPKGRTPGIAERRWIKNCCMNPDDYWVTKITYDSLSLKNKTTGQETILLKPIKKGGK